MKEIWRDVKGYEGLYQVSNCGRIKSLPRNGTIKAERILKQTIDSTGYLIVGLHKNNKAKKVCVHWVVANAFIPRRENDEVINHIDGNKYNNKLSNLERCTQSHNVKESFRLGLEKPYNEKKVLQYDLSGKFLKEWKSGAEAGRQLKISQGNIRACCRKVAKTAGKYIWRFKEEI